ncbi:hypothetical protein TWF481_010830 [Arthrobotrys musiformis]|uniref:Uncharacterized protein n=1 Tax=Arthrobotrys musiformis TaxID=47236 RepID=A0AAV9W1Z9_9PEZI
MPAPISTPSNTQSKRTGSDPSSQTPSSTDTNWHDIRAAAALPPRHQRVEIYGGSAFRSAGYQRQPQANPSTGSSLAGARGSYAGSSG